MSDDTKIAVICQLEEHEVDMLADLGRQMGMTAQGYLTALAQQAVRRATEIQMQAGLRKALIVASSPERCQQFLANSSTLFQGWSVVFVLSDGDGQAIRGSQFECAVLLDSPSEDLKRVVSACTRLGDAPVIVKAGLLDRFDPAAAVEMERARNIVDGRHG